MSKVFCINCKYSREATAGNYCCDHKSNWIEHTSAVFTYKTHEHTCIELNSNNDCRHFKPAVCHILGFGF